MKRNYTFLLAFHFYTLTVRLYVSKAFCNSWCETYLSDNQADLVTGAVVLLGNRCATVYVLTVL